ncbi:MAG: esterase family protein [Anaerolineales bacterium]|nr:esterase family protein [Anaerolineales bacterium]
MNTRQAILKNIFFTFLFGLSACSTSNEIPHTPTATQPPPPTSTATFTPSPVPPTATATPLTCLTAAGQVKPDVVSTTNPPQEFLIYLPPCYETQTELNYPVLYLLHGQTYNQDQWVRLGVPTIADQLIQSGEASPFIVVFPDDRYWNLPAGAGFGNRLIRDLIPYVDAHYRTYADREHRALGGLSRGGGWTVQLGFEHPELFSILGLHSPAIFKDNAPVVERIIKNIPEAERPRLWFDVGDADRELGSATLLEEALTRQNYFHEFHLFTGDHSESYWGAHVGAYLRWYAEQWSSVTAEQ